MNSITIIDLIRFRNKKNDSSKKTFLAKILAPKVKKADSESKTGGGNHWQFSLCAINKSFVEDNRQIITDKIVEVERKRNDITYHKKGMCDDNLYVLKQFEHFDFNQWKPTKEITFLKHQSSVLNINGLPIMITPRSIFRTNKNEIGAIWLMGKKSGLNDQERGMYTEALFMALKERYDNQYTVNPDYCLAVDFISNKSISYSQLQKDNIPKVLKPTIDEIIKLI